MLTQLMEMYILILKKFNDYGKLSGIKQEELEAGIKNRS